jgi:hypothetical protein
MKKITWVIPMMAALFVFAGFGAFAGMMQCGMMQGDTTQCPMVHGDTTQCPMYGDMTQCPIMQDGQSSDGTTYMECPHIQQTGVNTTTKKQTETKPLNMVNTSMAECEHAACICDHSSGACINNTGMICSCCDMCVTGGMCPEGCCNMDMLKAIIDVYPGNINLLGKGKYITVYIELDENDNGFSIDDIDKSTIYLKQVNSMMCPEGDKINPVGAIAYGDYDEDGVNDLMVKFNRQTIVNFLLADGLNSNEASMCLAGELYDGTKFSGKDTIAVTGDKLLKMWMMPGLKR